MIARHACGGAIWAHLAFDQDPDTTPHHLWCDGCRAFAPAGEPFPTGTDRAANRAAWEAGEPRSAGEPWPPADDRPEHAIQPDEAGEAEAEADDAGADDAGDAGCPMCGCAEVAFVATFGPGRILRRCRACGWDRMDRS